jgi:hypothetical protein
VKRAGFAAVASAAQRDGLAVIKDRLMLPFEREATEPCYPRLRPAEVEKVEVEVTVIAVSRRW